MLCIGSLNHKVQLFADWSAEEMANQASCGLKESLECRDKGLALSLKLGAIATILIASALGVALPLLGRRIRALRSDGTLFVITKAFAAGVILATGFVHMLPDGMEALNNDCLPEIPFHKFPVSSCIAMLAALGTLLVDVLGTEYYEKKHLEERGMDEGRASPPSQVEWDELPNSISIDTGLDKATQVSGQTNGDHMHIVGMRAHAASHGHSHPHGHHSCVDTTHEHVHGQFGHSHMSSTLSEDALAHIRHVIVSQVLELGIVAHSIIIGFSLGVSQSPCTIRPLIAALSFHQFFEGLALGGCISQAGFKSLSSVVMASCFAVTTPVGIAIGIAVASSYNADSRRALVVEGVFDSISAGILVYMALVDLIAADFLSKRMCCNHRLQVMSYTTLFLGAAAMSALAIWA